MDIYVVTCIISLSYKDGTIVEDRIVDSVHSNLQSAEKYIEKELEYECRCIQIEKFELIGNSNE